MDYEIQNAREWEDPNQPSRPVPPWNQRPTNRAPYKRRLRDAIAFDQDSSARTAWRKNEPATTTYDLGDETLSVPTQELNRIHQITGAYIPQPGYTAKVLEIWGTESQVRLARDQLQSWVAAALRKKANDPVVKERPKDIRNAWATFDNDETIAQNFLKARPAAKVWPHNGYFRWAPEFDPYEVFGNNLEALDPIRKDEWVHLDYFRDSSVFEIVSDYQNSISNTQDRLLVLLKEVVCRYQDTRRSFMIEPIPESELRKFIQLTEATHSKDSVKVAPNYPTLAGDRMDEDEKAAYFKRYNESLPLRMNELKKLVTSSLEGMAMYRGWGRMRIHVGKIVAKRHQAPPAGGFTHEKFENMTQSHFFKCELNRDITSVTSLEYLLDKFSNSKNVFQSSAKSPTYHIATFDIKLAHLGFVRLQIRFYDGITTAGSGSRYEADPGIWMRSFKSPGAASTKVQEIRRPLESHFLRLHAKLDWKLEIEANSFVDVAKISDQMEKFERSVKLRPGASHAELIFNSSIAAVLFASHTSFWSFPFKKSSYVLDVSQSRLYMGGGKRTPPTQRPTNLGVSIRRQFWDDCFGSQKESRSGKVNKFNWSPTVEEMFPSEDENLKNARTSVGTLFTRVHEALDLIEAGKTTSAKMETK